MTLVVEVPHIDARRFGDVDDPRPVRAPTPSDILSILCITGPEDWELITLQSRLPDAEIVSMHGQQQVIIKRRSLKMKNWHAIIL